MMAPVSADLSAEVASQPVHGAANVSQLLLRCEAFDVPAVPQNPSGHRHQHEQSPCKMNQKVLTCRKRLISPGFTEDARGQSGRTTPRATGAVYVHE